MSAKDPFSGPGAISGLAREIEIQAAKIQKQLTIMEVCGSHTHAIARAGLRSILPPQIRLISGPGCPVCVTPVEWLDRAIALVERGDVILASFGDLMRVPSSRKTLEEIRSEGAQVEILYSPRDALKLARTQPEKKVVFLAVGFETTAPTIAAAILEAEAQGIENFMILPGNKTMPEPMRLIADDSEICVDAFLLPGHVSVITGTEAFEFLARDFHLSGIVTGFAPTDVLRAILEIIVQHSRGEARIVNAYGRVVNPQGNIPAQKILERVFCPSTASWRGLGEIPVSGLDLKPELSHRNAALLEVDLPEAIEPPGCRCGEVLKGIIDPPECSLFGGACVPERPVGACMVSSEGSCAAWYRHERWRNPESPP